MQFRLNNEKIRKNKAKNFLTKNQKLILADTHDFEPPHPIEDGDS